MLERDRWSYLWLLIGGALLAFSQGRWIIAAAAWLAPLFLLRFLRTQPSGRGLLLGAGLHVVIAQVWFTGVIPAVGGIPQPVLIALFGLIAYIPYVADRLLTPRLSGWSRALLCPLAWTSVSYLNTLLNPMGSWGALTYTQADNLPLLQVVSP